MSRLQFINSLARISGCAAFGMFCWCWTAGPAIAATEMDDFSSVVDYSGGGVAGIWDGSYNMPNLAGGLFGSNFFGAEELTVDDNGVTNVGWEGGRSTAPFLFTNVPAGEDFRATVKISAQTSGTWSAAGLIARASNSPTAPGTGADNDDENFVTLYSFRTDDANPDLGNTLNKRIEAGAQLADLNIDINPGTIPNPGTPPPDTVPNPEPLPIWLRLERVGGVGYRSYVSTNGVDFQLQSHTIPTAGNALRDASVGMQVGLGYMNFGTLAGTSKFDDFEIETFAPAAAPGAPDISASQYVFSVTPGTVIQELITDATAQGTVEWTRSVNLPGTDGLFPSGLGPGIPVLDPPVDVPPANGTTFYWNTAGRPIGEQQIVLVNATNDWGEMSNTLTFTINIIPEPTGAGLAGLAIVGLVGFIRRRML